MTDALVLLPLQTYDFVARRKPHAATIWGGLFL